MPVNLDVLLRFHTIDKCLQNRFRKWTLQDLIDACSDALEKNISKRTIQNDIQRMRGAELGYHAPIICKNGLYSYEDKDYSIKNATLSKENIQAIAMAGKILGQYKGFKLQQELQEISDKLEDKKLRDKFKDIERIIEFEQANEVGGKEFLQPILEAIQSKVVLDIEYKRFDAGDAKNHRVHPYLLKEYRGRWYLLGLNHKHHVITTYALDRIVNTKKIYSQDYIENDIFDPTIYFKNTIGITYQGESPIKVTLFVDNIFVPYLLTLPLHSSQSLIKRTGEGALFQLEVIHNPEFETLILGYAGLISIVGPEDLRLHFINKLDHATKRYEENCYFRESTPD